MDRRLAYRRIDSEVLGDRLGCGGTVSSLRREKIGPFDISEALSLEAARAQTAPDLALRLLNSLPALDRALKAAAVK